MPSRLRVQADLRPHDDILFAPHKTPNFDIKQARMHRDGVTTVLIEHFQPSKYLLDALAAD